MFKLNVEHSLPIQTAYPRTYPRIPAAKFSVTLHELDAHALVQCRDHTCLALPIKNRFSVTCELTGYLFLRDLGGVPYIAVATGMVIVAR